MTLATPATPPGPRDDVGERGLAMWRVFGIAAAVAVLALVPDAALRTHPTDAHPTTPPTQPAGGPSGPSAGSPPERGGAGVALDARREQP